MRSKHFTTPYMQSPPPAVFHDKYQREIWKNTAGKSATAHGDVDHLSDNDHLGLAHLTLFTFPMFSSHLTLPYLNFLSSSEISSIALELLITWLLSQMAENMDKVESAVTNVKFFLKNCVYDVCYWLSFVCTLIASIQKKLTYKIIIHSAATLASSTLFKLRLPSSSV